jgi:hypothetical protein
MTDIEIAWLAGLLEGEGSFYHSWTCGNPYPRIYVCSTDKDVIEKVANLMNSKVHLRSERSLKLGWSTQWATSLQGRKATNIMKAILPYMGERRSSKIRSLLDYEGYKNTRANTTEHATVRD